MVGFFWLLFDLLLIWKEGRTDVEKVKGTFYSDEH